MITRRGGGVKCYEGTVTFDSYFDVNYDNVLNIDVGFKPVFLYMENKDPNITDNAVATRFSVSFTPGWSAKNDSSSMPYGSWWWTNYNNTINGVNPNNYISSSFLPTETGIVSKFGGNYTYAPNFKGTYTVWAYG